jgi:RNA polymerase sigma factor (sigma-70 family)
MEAAAILRGLPAQRRAAAFERECERLRPLGEAFLMRRFGGSLNRADAEDAVAEVVIRLHSQMAAGHPPQNLRAAFFTSVRNAAIDVLRSRAAKPTVGLETVAEAPAPSPSPSERAESREDAVRLSEALARLRGNYREAIVLRFGLGLSVPEIAQHLGISLPAAKKLLLRATQQVRKRLEAIEAAQFCPEMRELARSSLFEKKASGLASEAEAEVLNAHFEHCGSCRSFLASLHDSLHELGGGALIVGVAADQLDGRVGIVGHLARWFGAGVHPVQAGAAKLRFAAFKASGALQPGDAGGAGALAGTGQKIAAVCTAGAATTVTCLAAGVVGPGIGSGAPLPSPARHSPPAKVKVIAEPVSQAPSVPTTTTPPESKPAPTSESGSSSPQASEPSSTPAPSEAPAQEGQAEFGIEHRPPPAPESAPAPDASTAGSGSSSSGSGLSSGAAGKGGSESFGFHG